MGNSIIEQLMILHLEARIIHRDIKPSNLMVCQQQNLVKIIDFGLSAYLKTDGESGNTS
jgi:serine/threonine protein kinase